MKLLPLQIMVASTLLSGCAVTSFAPPQVPTHHKIQSNAADICVFDRTKKNEQIVPGVLGALVLIDNYRQVYACAASEAANGRQIFQLPSLLAAVAAGVGPTFGLDNDGAIAALTGAAVYDRANTYFSPKEKAEMLTAARDAVNCVGAAAVGMDFFDTRVRATEEAATAAVANANALSATIQDRLSALAGDLQNLQNEQDQVNARVEASGKQGSPASAAAADIAERSALLQRQQEAISYQIGLLQRDSNRLQQQVQAAQATLSQGERGLLLRTETPNGDYIEIDVTQVYFERVKVALDAIDTVLADRLRGAGSYDRASLIKEIQDLAKQEAEVTAEGDEEKQKMEGLMQNALDPNKISGQALIDAIKYFNQQEAIRSLKVDLQALTPRLTTCVARAKIG